MRESTRFMSLSTPIVILEPQARGIGDLLPSHTIRKEGTTVVVESFSFGRRWHGV